MEQQNNHCNCIQHFCSGYEAGKRDARRTAVARLSHTEIMDISAHNIDRQYVGNYAVTVYHRPSAELFAGSKTWMLALEILTDKCRTNITKLTFEPDEAVKTYEYGLVED